MKTWYRKLRGAVGIGAIWALAFSALGFALGAIVGMIRPEILPSTVFESLVYVVVNNSIVGFVFGSAFAVVLTTMDGRKTFEKVTPGRGALWGALTGVGGMTVTALITLGLGSGGGLPLAELIPTFVIPTCIFGAVTAGLGAGTVSLARRAPAELDAGRELHESLPLGDPGESRTLQRGSA